MSGTFVKVGVTFYMGMAIFQFANIGRQFTKYDSRISNWIDSFPDSAQFFALTFSLIFGGALWPITLPVMIARDMKEKNKKD